MFEMTMWNNATSVPFPAGFFPFPAGFFNYENGSTFESWAHLVLVSLTMRMGPPCTGFFNYENGSTLYWFPSTINMYYSM